MASWGVSTLPVLKQIHKKESIVPGQSTLEVTGVLGQQHETGGLLVRDFSLKKWGHSVRRPKGVKREN